MKPVRLEEPPLLSAAKETDVNSIQVKLISRTRSTTLSLEDRLQEVIAPKAQIAEKSLMPSVSSLQHSEFDKHQLQLGRVLITRESCATWPKFLARLSNWGAWNRREGK